MKSKKIAWIIAHDAWLDHRLYFFHDCLSKLGFSPQIIGEHVPFGGPLNFDYRDTTRAEDQLLCKSVEELVASDFKRIFEKKAFGPRELQFFLDHVRDALREKKVPDELPPFERWGQEGDQFVARMEGAAPDWVMHFDSKSNQIRIARKRSDDDTNREMQSFLRSQGLAEFEDRIYDCSRFFNTTERILAESGAPDLIYVADLPTLPVALLWKNKLNVPVIFDAHEWWKEQYAVWGDGQAEQLDFIDRSERVLYPMCDIRITVGSKLAKKMSDHFGSPFETIFTTNAMGEETPKTSSNFWHKYIPTYSGEKVLLFQGNLTEKRNLEIIPELAKHLVGSKIIFAIAGDGPFREKLEKLVRAANVESVVKILGWFNQNQLADLTTNADLGYVPYVAISDYYSVGAPNKVFEYIASSLPFVYDRSMLEIDYIASRFGLGESVPINDAATSAESIKRLIFSPERLRGLQNAMAKAKSVLSPAAQQDELIQALQKQI